MKKKRCLVCKKPMQKWGKNRNGSTRFRCRHCGSSSTRKRSDLSSKYKKDLFQNWLLGKISVTEVAQKQSVTRQTLYTWFRSFWNDEPLPKRVDICDGVLIIDGKYVERDATVLIACIFGRVVSWQFTQSETSSSWHAFLGSLHQIPFAIVCDGQRGMLKAIK